VEAREEYLNPQRTEKKKTEGKSLKHISGDMAETIFQKHGIQYEVGAKYPLQVNDVSMKGMQHFDHLNHSTVLAEFSCH
jgi:hypothetical protein